MNYDIQNFDDLSKIVEENGQIITVTMEQLRNMHGVSRLGKFVVDAISGELKKRGLNTIPHALPMYQQECVRIYRIGTPTEKLIKSIMDIGNKDNISEYKDNDDYIRGVVDTKASEVLKKIKELIN